MCYTLGWIVQRGCSRRPGNGALTGATVAFGLIGATLALNYGFEARGITLWLINAGYVVVGLVIAGAIIGGWRKQAKPTTDADATLTERLAACYTGAVHDVLR